MPDPLALPAVDPQSVDAWNAVVGSGRTVAVALAGVDCQLRFTPSANADCSSSAVEIVGGNRRVWIELADWQGWPAVAELLGELSLAELPSEIAAATLAAAFEPALAQLARFAGPCEVVSFGPAPSGDEHLRLGLACSRADGVESTGALVCNAAALAEIARAIGTIPAATSAVRGDLPLTAPVEIGLTRITPAELAAVRRHDVLLLDVASPANARTGVIRLAPQLCWRVAVDADSVALVAPVTPPASGSDSADAELGIVLTVALGSVSVLAADAANLAAEQTLPLEGGDVAGVFAAGRLIGRGELVAVAGRQGVRLAQWNLLP